MADMRLEKLTVFNFKNYEEAQLDFKGNIHCFLGKNGSGKTNLLDAIYYLSFTKSSTNSSDSQNIRVPTKTLSGFGSLREQNQFFVKGTFLKNDKPAEVICSFQQGQKKIVKENELECSKFSEHIGKYPAVMVAPQDIELIWDGSEVRRKFFDSLISQLDRIYLDHLISYTSYLKQRNSALRLFSERGKVDHDLLASYDQVLIPAANYIFNKRKEFVGEFIPRLIAHYRFLSDEAPEEIAIQYRSDLEEMSWADALQKNLNRDLFLQRTTTGVHRDDFLFSLNGNELKRFGSQGQQKSFLIGLKLAEFDSININKGLKPLLLLDDIFDKLDDFRINKLMQLVARENFGQIFITDARPSRTKEILKQSGIEAELFELENGNLIKNGKGKG
jgi:DNA replication and repair protein RecF